MVRRNIWHEDWRLLNKKDKQFLELEGNEMLFPFMNRLCGRMHHLDTATFINKYIFTKVPKTFLKGFLFFNMKPDPYVKTPKGSLIKDDILELVKPYIKKMYNWSEREFVFQKKIISSLLLDKSFVNDLNKYAGFNKKECKTLGIDFSEIKKIQIEKKPEKPKSNGIFDFI